MSLAQPVPQDACLIDSKNGLHFTKDTLATRVTEWSTKIRSSIPHPAQLATAGGFYFLVALPKSAAAVIGCLATTEMKCAYVMSDFDDTSSIAERVRPVAVFVEAGDSHMLSKLSRCCAAESCKDEQQELKFNVSIIEVDVDACTITKVTLPSRFETVAHEQEWQPERVLDPDVRYITFSSGSSGRPKGIFGSHFCVNSMNECRNKLFPYDNKDGQQRWTVAVNIFLLWECFRPLQFGGGGCCLVVRQEDFVDPERYLALLIKYDVNEILVTSSYAKVLLAAFAASNITHAPQSLRRVWQNGEPMTATLREAMMEFFADPKCELLNLYSISECYEVGWGNIRESSTVLRTFPDVTVATDPETNECIVTTPTIRFGYHKGTDKENAVFIHNMKSYRTGDIAKLHFCDEKQEDGDSNKSNSAAANDNPPRPPRRQLFELAGRCSNFIRVKGRFVTMEQVADVVERGLELKHGNVQCYVENGGELVAYVDGGFKSELLAKVAEACPFPEWMPDRFVHRAHTPLLPGGSGKAVRTPTNSSPSSSSDSSMSFPTVLPGGKELLKSIHRVLLDLIGVDVEALEKPMSLRDLGVTSLSVMRLKAELKKQVDVDMTVGELYKISDVRKFAADVVTPGMLCVEVESVVKQVMTVAAAAAAASASASSATVNNNDDANDEGEDVYFITGSTGYLGGWMVNQLTKKLGQSKRKVRILLLVRKDEAAARKIFADRKLLLPPSGSVEFLQGDISKPNLGLSPEMFLVLQSRVRFIVHAAAHVVFGCSYFEAKPSTVDGTLNILKLYAGCRRSNRPELHFVSTNGVYPPFFTANNNGRPCAESQDDFEKYAPLLKEGYGYSKWVAEKSVKLACAKLGDKPVRVYRPGNIGWATDGRYNVNDFQTMIVFACREVNAVPDEKTWNFEMTPVDVLADFVLSHCGSMMTPAAGGGDDDGDGAAQPPKVAETFKVHNVIGKRVPMDFYLPATIPRVPMEKWIEMAGNMKGASDSVEQTRASFVEYETLAMYLSDTNDYFSQNSLCYEPTEKYAQAI